MARLTSPARMRRTIAATTCARLLYRHFLGQHHTVHVEIIELKQYHGRAADRSRTPAWAKEYRAAGEGQIDLQHKAVALTSVAWDDGTDDLVVDLAGAQFGNWPTYCRLVLRCRCVWEGGVSGCHRRGLAATAKPVNSLCPTPSRPSAVVVTRSAKGCGGTGKFLVDARYRSRADAPWGVQLETPHWKEWVKRYATPEFRASGFEVSLRPWPGEDMMITFDGKVVRDSQERGLVVEPTARPPKQGRNHLCACGSGPEVQEMLWQVTRPMAADPVSVHGQRPLAHMNHMRLVSPPPRVVSPKAPSRE